MSTLKATNLSHASAASPNIVLDSAGKTTFGGAVVGAGMDLITPTSVAGTGVTVSGGAVTFTAATSVSVNGCFTATYDNYKIVLVGISSSAGAAVPMRVRAAGTDASGSDYVSQLVYGDNTTVAGSTTTTTSFPTAIVCNTVSMIADISLFRPFLAATTQTVVVGGRSNYLSTTSGYHNQAVSYDGFSILPSAINITGTLRVYGYRNS